ncbi:hypothetical protein K502DRAFT_324416 [Neoconidiobolus thromboides FSU 785]|nr:hypothetical protein K502DRAFT_324416 [Neoconidiobolus thromboides FSU 785]
MIIRNKILVLGREQLRKWGFIEHLASELGHKEGYYEPESVVPFELNIDSIKIKLKFYLNTIKDDDFVNKDYRFFKLYSNTFVGLFYTFRPGEEEMTKNDLEKILAVLPRDDVKLRFCILLNDNKDCDEMELNKLIYWCNQNLFEFIDLTQSSRGQDEGVERIIEVLYSQNWKGLIKLAKELDKIEDKIVRNRVVSNLEWDSLNHED